MWYHLDIFRWIYSAYFCSVCFSVHVLHFLYLTFGWPALMGLYPFWQPGCFFPNKYCCCCCFKNIGFMGFIRQAEWLHSLYCPAYTRQTTAGKPGFLKKVFSFFTASKHVKNFRLSLVLLLSFCIVQMYSIMDCTKVWHSHMMTRYVCVIIFCRPRTKCSFMSVFLDGWASLYSTCLRHVYCTQRIPVERDDIRLQRSNWN